MMRPLSALILLVLALPSAAARDAAEEDYQAARRAYYLLKDDAQRRKFRHQWLNVANRFEAVARKNPQSRRAPDSLFTAARLLAELSRISMLDEDLRAAVSDYESIVERYPKDNLADDAALALGRIYLERVGETEKARRIVEHALTDLPRGDARPALVSLRALLPASPVPKPTGKRVLPRNEAARPASGADSAQAKSATAGKASGSTDSAQAKPTTAGKSAGSTDSAQAQVKAAAGVKATAPSEPGS